MTSAIIIIAVLFLLAFGLTVVRGAPYVPSHRLQVRRAFRELYQLSEADTLVDLGSGDGTVLRIANQQGARSLGFEINPFLWLICKARFWGNSQVDVRLRDYRLLRSLPDGVTVVYAFSSSHNIDIIDRKMQQWSESRKLVLISYGFEVTDKTPTRRAGPMYLYTYEPEA